THSEQLDEHVLVESAKTKSQDHLMAISRRKVLTEKVTDVLVDRGNRQVAISTAGNPGAAFSEFGYSTLVGRSQTDDHLAVCVCSGLEMQRRHLLGLFAEAWEKGRVALEASDRRKAELIREMVTHASNEMQTEARRNSDVYATAHARVLGLHKAGKLD